MNTREAERRKRAMESDFGYAVPANHACGSNLVTRRTKGRCCGCGERWEPPQWRRAADQQGVSHD